MTSLQDSELGLAKDCTLDQDGEEKYVNDGEVGHGKQGGGWRGESSVAALRLVYHEETAKPQGR